MPKANTKGNPKTKISVSTKPTIKAKKNPPKMMMGILILGFMTIPYRFAL